VGADATEENRALAMSYRLVMQNGRPLAAHADGGRANGVEFSTSRVPFLIPYFSAQFEKATAADGRDRVKTSLKGFESGY
jgi:hypothetical protein